MMDIDGIIEDTNSHVLKALSALDRGEAGIHLLEAEGMVAAETQIALVHATLALVQETRTAAIMSYFGTLPEDERHEGAVPSAVWTLLVNSIDSK